ncbi:MAG: hypothetical protein V4727_07950 [Verrucomicrobiota bacterium]
MKKTATFLLAIGLTSCFAPKATVVAEAPVNAAPKKNRTTQTAVADLSPEAIKPTPLPGRRDGLRLPDMLALPQDDQLRSAPGTTKDGKATVIARPPEE